MTEQGELSKYEIAKAEFEGMAPPYSPTELLTSLVGVQTVGHNTGIDDPVLYSDMVDLSGLAAERADLIPNEDSARNFRQMQGGYKSILSRITKASDAPKPSRRSRTGVAAG